MQDLIWVALAVAFFLFSGWFVGFSGRLMPAAHGQRDAAMRAEPADGTEARP